MRLIRCLFALLVVWSGLLHAATPAEQLLGRAEQAMAVSTLQRIQYIGQGSARAIGQSFEPSRYWPRLQYTGYALLADYTHSALREEIVRERKEVLGGPPGQGEQRLVQFYRENAAWNMLGPVPLAMPSVVPERVVMLWSTPHGALIAARRNMNNLQLQGARTLVFQQAGQFTMAVVLNPAYQVQEVRATFSHAVLGDTVVSHRYSNYQKFGSTPFPARIVQSWAGQTALDVTVQQVQTNTSFIITTPVSARDVADRVLPQELASGVWLLTGGGHHSVAIAMQDHIVLVDSPLSDARAQSMRETMATLAPDKPIRQVISTHPHFDTVAGIRGMVAHGAELVVAESHRAFFNRILAAQHTITPDTLAKTEIAPVVTGVVGQRTLRDDRRTIEIYTIQGSQHAKDHLMVVLPAEKLLIQVDAYTPAPAFSVPPSPPAAAHVNLLSNIERFRLDIERIVPLRGRVVNINEFLRAVQTKP
jgi:glyoxylase-like metal-dependent hydrolase (beta-lactamase superfamily II)